MKFGVFDHLDRYDLPLADYYEARLKIIEAYEHFKNPMGPSSAS